MFAELYELKDGLAECLTGAELVDYCWNTNIKNNTGYGYMAGMLDALFWAGQLTQQEYTNYYKKFGF